MAKTTTAPARTAKADLAVVTTTSTGTGVAKGAIRTGNLMPATVAMLDVLCNGRWHAKDEILAVGAAAMKAEEFGKVVEEGKRARKGREATVEEYAESGARHFARNNLMILVRRGRVMEDKATGRVRMTATAARQWRRDRSAEATEAVAPETPAATRQRFGDEQTFGGMLEFDGWAHAPLVARDVAYVRPNVAFDLDLMREAFPGWLIKEDPDGLVAIAAPTGTPVKDTVTDWLVEHDIHHEGVRDSRNVRRRNPNDLPPRFLEDLVKQYTRYAMNRVRKNHAMSMQRLVGDMDDVSGVVGLWVMEAIENFDATRGVPFGAWLTNQLPNKVMNLNRASYGRTAADAEMKRARVMENYEAQHGHAPSPEKLRELLGLSEEEMARKERDLANLRGLRSTGTLETGIDAPELPVIDLSADPEADVLHMEMMQKVSNALLAASGEWDPNTGRPIKLRQLGFLVLYLVHWQEWTKGDLTTVAGRASRFVTEEVNAVSAELAAQLADLRAEIDYRPDSTAEFVVG